MLASLQKHLWNPPQQFLTEIVTDCFLIISQKKFNSLRNSPPSVKPWPSTLPLNVTLQPASTCLSCSLQTPYFNTPHIIEPRGSAPPWEDTFKHRNSRTPFAVTRFNRSKSYSFCFAERSAFLVNV